LDTADAQVTGPRPPAAGMTAARAGATGLSPASTARPDPNPVAASVGGLQRRIGVSLPVAPQPAAGVVALTLAIGGGGALAVELVRGGGGGFASVIAFNVWLRRQLRETRMSQRQLAAFSGVDHSTISRLMSGERAPSLATATKLTKALHKLGGMPHAGDYFARLADVRELPTRRVEAALLGDEELDDEDVRALMHAYVAARARRRRLRAAAENGEAMPSEGPRPA
jgi:transcriptional regulator with XRE-family HTH domain